jgi:hypothetical protein
LVDGEANPVMEKLRSAGLEIKAVHNHLLGETPNCSRYGDTVA